MRPPHTLPYVYFSLLPPADAVRAIAGLGRVEQSRVGQAPAFELVDGLQTLPRVLSESIATNLVAMVWQPAGATRAYIAYSPANYASKFRTEPPAVGYPPEASEPGAIILVDPATMQPTNAAEVGTPISEIAVIVAGDRATAMQFAAPGGNYGIVYPLQVVKAPAEKKGPSTGAIIAGIAAAAVAALLIFA